MKLKLPFFIILFCIILNSFVCTVYSPSGQKTFNEVSKNGNVLNISQISGGSKTTVYKEEDNATYHLRNCPQINDYSRPCLLSDIVMDGIRCTQCISDRMYYSCRDAVFQAEIKELPYINRKMKIQTFYIIILTVIIMLLIGYIMRKNDFNKDK